MQTLRLNRGDLFPVIGLGTWKADPGEVGQAVKEAIRAGYRHIDCAAIYANEAEIGRALSELFREGAVERKDLWFTSKLWNSSHAPEHVLPACKKTLEDLQLNYLDLYLMHWPIAFRHDLIYPEKAADCVPLSKIPLIETWKAMEHLVDEGLCRNLGVANFSLTKLKALMAQSNRKPQVNQVEMHPYLAQPDLFAYCREQSIVMTAYAPLGSAGRPEHLKARDEPVLLRDPVIAQIAAEQGASPAQVLLQWGIARGTVVIPKSVNPGRIQENFGALNVNLSPSMLARIDQLNRNRRYFDGSFWNFPEAGYTSQTLWDE